MNQTSVLTIAQYPKQELQGLLGKYGLTIQYIDHDTNIPGSFWGDSEAGLINDDVFVRPDTPIHSLLHESCHYICMSPVRRNKLHTNAGGTLAEENAVCYLQIRLAGELQSMGSERMMSDMDSWGYTFRLGSAQAWFTDDAEDAYQWLIQHELLDQQGNITFQKKPDIKQIIRLQDKPV